MLTKPGDVTYVHTVFTAPGLVNIDGEVNRKARLWVLEDRTVIVVRPSAEGSGGVERLSLGLAAKLVRTSSRTAEVELGDGRLVRLVEADCGCGMGYSAHAGPIEGRWKIQRVRRPEWFEGG